MKIGIVGPGAIGRFLAVRLSAAGSEVVLVGPHPPDPAALAATDIAGVRTRPGDNLVSTSDPRQLAGVDVCLVTVKCAATLAVASELARALSAHTPVVSFQNGLRNVEQLSRELGARAVGGVVSYNVFREGEEVRQASAGLLLAGMLGDIEGDRLRRLRIAFRRAGEKLSLRNDIERVMAGKLLLNLNNGVCAATGLSISESLRSRDARWCFAACLGEGNRIMQAVGMSPARVTALPPRVIAAMLRLPDAIVLRAARSIAGVDPSARSSTLQDLDRMRRTEIDELNGAIPWLASRAGLTAPANDVVTRVVHDHEEAVLAGRPPRYLAPEALRERIAQASRRFTSDGR